MSTHKMHLRKLLQLFYLPEGKARSLLRPGVITYIKMEKDEDTGGMDFHGPFWGDAKDHIEGNSDLTEQTKERIKRNKLRKNLYPRLEKKFLEWLNEKKRWTNEGLSLFQKPVRGRYKVPGFNSIVKVNNFLPLNVGSQPTRFFYPYFSDKPELSEEAARIGLWLMTQSATGVPNEGLKILDVLRAKSFSLKKNPLKGNEEALFNAHYARIRAQWDELYDELRED